ncbi:MAG: SurA N-terminal domain-containing protein [bacterium]
MLNYIRKYTGNWGLKVLYVLIALTFLGGFGGIFGMLRSCGTGLSEGTVAVVGSNAISVDDFSRAYRNALNAYMRNTKDQEMLNKLDLPDIVLNSLIQDEIATKEAHSIGFIVTKQELADQISHMSAFLNKDHRFDPRIYYAVLRENNLTPDDFQNNVSKEILILKLKKLFYDNLFLSPGEIKILSAGQSLHEQQNEEQIIDAIRYSIAQNAYNTLIKHVEEKTRIEKNSAIVNRFTQTTY